MQVYPIKNYQFKLVGGELGVPASGAKVDCFPFLLHLYILVLIKTWKKKDGMLGNFSSFPLVKITQTIHTHTNKEINKISYCCKERMSFTHSSNDICFSCSHVQ
jgi:hypothetical protein